MSHECETPSLSWQIEVPDSSFPLLLARKELCEIALDTTSQTIETISRAFSLDDDTVGGIWRRASKLDVVLVAGNGSEYFNDEAEELPVGPAALAMSRTVETSLQEPKTKIFYSLSGIEDEMRNIDAAYRDLDLALKQNPAITSIDRGGIDVLADVNDRTRTAVALSFARRLIKYGLLPDGIMSDDSLKEYGLSYWIENCQTLLSDKQSKDSLKTKSLSEDDKKLLQHIYFDKELAVKNLRRTIWSSVYRNIVDPEHEIHRMFHILYASHASVAGNNHTIAFNDEKMSCHIDDPSETKECLSAIFNPNHKPKKRRLKIAQ